MSIVEELNKSEKWDEFLNYKLTRCSITKKNKEILTDFIKNKKYENISHDIINGSYVFSLPQKKLINKIDSNKKRVVYTFSNDEMIILKFISYLLYKYDNSIPDNCYSFRKEYGVRNAIYTLTSKKNINELCAYKVDISNYFNSVNTDILLPILKGKLEDDNKLFELMKEILINKDVISKGKIITEKKGIMAGVPISSFLANIYLNDIDHFFKEENVLYARYSDDIIILAEKEKIGDYVKILKDKLEEHELTININKENFFGAGEKWEFLGFEYDNGKIDLSNIARKKIKGKIRRSARKLRRWMLKKDATPDRAIRAMNKKFNYKFFSKREIKDLSWINWYFPIINTDKSLKEIDNYMQEYLRYIVTGRFNKKNYEKVTYNFLKECCYKSLVSEYYMFQKMNREQS